MKGHNYKHKILLIIVANLNLNSIKHTTTDYARRDDIALVHKG